MKKAEMISAVARECGMTKKDTEQIVDAVFRCIGDAMKQGDRVCVTGFGTFDTRERAEREVEMPGMREKVTVHAAKVPVFRPAKQLKEKMNT